MTVIRIETLELIYDGLRKEAWVRAVRDSQDQGLRLEFSTDDHHWEPIEWPQMLARFEEDELFGESEAAA